VSEAWLLREWADDECNHGSETATTARTWMDQGEGAPLEQLRDCLRRIRIQEQRCQESGRD
jgi:hypothetical protein